MHSAASSFRISSPETHCTFGDGQGGSCSFRLLSFSAQYTSPMPGPVFSPQCLFPLIILSAQSPLIPFQDSSTHPQHPPPQQPFTCSQHYHQGEGGDRQTAVPIQFVERSRLRKGSPLSLGTCITRDWQPTILCSSSHAAAAPVGQLWIWFALMRQSCTFYVPTQYHNPRMCLCVAYATRAPGILFRSLVLNYQ